MAVPIMVTMIFTSLYNVVDGIWIAGLGEHAIAGIGIVTPLWMVITALSNGLSHGATSAISRYAATDKAKAERASEHAVMVYLAAGAALTIVLLAVLKPYINYYAVSAQTAQEAMAYSLPLFGGLISVTLSFGIAAIMRAEGDTKRPMYAMTLGVVLNGLLDPVFIYTLGWGAAGAAVSTVFTSFISAAIMAWWITKRKSYFCVKMKGIFSRHYDKTIIKDILTTGIPASFELLMMSIASFCFYSIIRNLGDDYGVSVYSSGYRLYLIALMPVTAISLAAVPIIGMHFGGKNIEWVRRAHWFCTHYALGCAAVTTLIMVVFAHHFASLFALTNDDTKFIDGIADFIRVTSFCIPFLAIGLPSTFMYLGLGKGRMSLMWTTINEVVCAVPATYLLGVVMGYGLPGVWLGFVVGRGLASTCNYIFSRRYINHLGINIQKHE